MISLGTGGEADTTIMGEEEDLLFVNFDAVGAPVGPWLVVDLLEVVGIISVGIYRAFCGWVGGPAVFAGGKHADDSGLIAVSAGLRIGGNHEKAPVLGHAHHL